MTLGKTFTAALLSATVGLTAQAFAAGDYSFDLKDTSTPAKGLKAKDRMTVDAHEREITAQLNKMVLAQATQPMPAPEIAPQASLEMPAAESPLADENFEEQAALDEE